MADPAAALTRQLLEWIDERPRTYAEAVETWRSTCPRLTIWEDACIAGLVEGEAGAGRIAVSERGRAVMGSGYFSEK